MQTRQCSDNDVTKESYCASVTNKFHSGKLCSAPPTKFFPYADDEDRRFLADSTITPQWNSQSYMLWFNFILDLNFIFLVLAYGNACVSLKQWEMKIKPRIK